MCACCKTFSAPPTQNRQTGALQPPHAQQSRTPGPDCGWQGAAEGNTDLRQGQAEAWAGGLAGGSQSFHQPLQGVLQLIVLQDRPSSGGDLSALNPAGLPGAPVPSASGEKEGPCPPAACPHPRPLRPAWRSRGPRLTFLPSRRCRRRFSVAASRTSCSGLAMSQNKSRKARPCRSTPRGSSTTGPPSPSGSAMLRCRTWGRRRSCARPASSGAAGPGRGRACQPRRAPALPSGLRLLPSPALPSSAPRSPRGRPPAPRSPRFTARAPCRARSSLPCPKGVLFSPVSQVAASGGGWKPLPAGKRGSVREEGRSPAERSGRTEAQDTGRVGTIDSGVRICMFCGFIIKP